ncbi:hypothetical protein BGZ92_005317, partial [Podila epicladia]
IKTPRFLLLSKPFATCVSLLCSALLPPSWPLSRPLLLSLTSPSTRTSHSLVPSSVARLAVAWAATSARVGATSTRPGVSMADTC